MVWSIRVPMWTHLNKRILQNGKIGILLKLSNLLCPLHMFPNISREKQFLLMLPISWIEYHLEFLIFKPLTNPHTNLSSNLNHLFLILNFFFYVLLLFIFTNNTTINLSQKPSSASFLAIPQTKKVTNATLPLLENSSTPWIHILWNTLFCPKTHI